MKTQTKPMNSTAKKAGLTQKKSSPPRSILSTTGNIHYEIKGAMNSRLQEEEIASRAYKIWQEQGCPEGFDEMHWRLAEQELLGASSEALAV